MKTTKRYEMVRRIAVEDKELHELKSRYSAQVMDKIAKIDHRKIGEIVKKHTHQMIGELIDDCFISTQWFEKLRDMIDDGIDMTMTKMKMAYAIDEAFLRHRQHAKIAAALDTGELGPVYNGKVTRKDWLRFMGQTIDSCMPGADGEDLIDPLTGLSDEEQAELDEMAREAWEEADTFDRDDKEDRDAELRDIMNVNSEVNDDEFPF